MHEWALTDDQDRENMDVVKIGEPGAVAYVGGAREAA